MDDSSGLQGRSALITGGASGIGAAIARRLAGLGVAVQIADLDLAGAQAVAAETGGEAWQLDLSDPAALGGIELEVDILVNNAGVQRVSPIEELDPEVFHRMLMIMVEAPFRLIRSALPYMYAQGYGRIVNVSSVHGLRASAYKSAYVTAKHALEGLSKVTALEGGPHGVTSNCVNPGYVRTPLVEKQIADQARIHRLAESEVLETIMLTHNADQAAGGARGGRGPGRLAGRSGCGHGHRSLLHHGRRVDSAVSSSYRSISAAVDGGRLHGGEWNPSGATTVVAVHGITANHRTFALLAEALPRHRLLAPDLRGRGASRTLAGAVGDRPACRGRRRADHGLSLGAGGACRPLDGRLRGHRAGPAVSGSRLGSGARRRRAAFPAALGIDADQAIAQTLGPALQRLQRTFPSRDAYRRFWQAHPALREAWSDAVADYVDYDLVGSPPELRSSVSSQAVLQDGRDQFQDPDTADVLGGFSGPARLLVMSRGLLGQPPGLYPDEELARWRRRLPRLTIDEVPQLNHYTIMLHPSGAALVAAAVRTLS